MVEAEDREQAAGDGVDVGGGEALGVVARLAHENEPAAPSGPGSTGVRPALPPVPPLPGTRTGVPDGSSGATSAAGAAGSRPGEASSASPRSSVALPRRVEPGRPQHEATGRRGDRSGDRSVVVGLDLPQEGGALAVPAQRVGQAAERGGHPVSLDGLAEPRVGHGGQQVEATAGLVHGQPRHEVEHGRGGCGVVALTCAAATAAGVDQLGPRPHRGAALDQPVELLGHVGPGVGDAGRADAGGEARAESGGARRLPHPAADGLGNERRGWW